MRNAAVTVTGIVVASLLLAACASARPVLYPNGTLAKDDINECMQLADNANLQDSQGERIAKTTAVHGTIGAVTGLAVGAVTGDAGRGAGIGAAAGGANGLMHGLFNSKQPDPLYKAYVDRCLRDRGYDTIGWR